MEVDAAVRGKGERVGFQDLAVVADDEEVGGVGAKLRAALFAVDCFGLPEGEVEFFGGRLHRRSFGTAAARGAGDDAQHFMRRGDESPEGGNGEGAGA